MVDTILTVIGDVGALAAAWFAFLALGKANATIKEAEAARLDAEQAAKDAATERREAAKDRRDAERDRMRRRIEHVGEILEAAASAAKEPHGRWATHLNRLRQALVGLHELLPECVELVKAVNTADQVGRYVSNARNEVELKLRSLSSELVRPD